MFEQARDSKERSRLIETLRAAIERSSRLISQVLASTRVSHHPIVRVPIDMKAVLSV
jgi:hypothetical protein